METREVRVVDAFADEPLGGVAVPVVPGENSLTDRQLRAVAREFGSPGVVTQRNDELRYVTDGMATPVCAAVAGCVGLAGDGTIEPGTHTLRTDRGTYTAELETGRRVVVDVPCATEPAAVEPSEVATALGLPTEAIADVDLPVGWTDAVGGSLLVPLVFFEQLGELSPDPATLAKLPGSRAFAFTFDTLTPEADVHARAFDADGREWATSGVGVAACARFLGTRGAFDDATEWLRFESGRFVDRPATLDGTLDDGRVAGRGLVTLDGTVSIPSDDSGEIVEL